MEVYIGGSFQGKLDYVVREKQLVHADVADGALCDGAEALCKPIINRLHLLLKRMLLEEEDIGEFIDRLIADNPEAIIICDEIGMGIVPQDKQERIYREAVGRSLCRLAAFAKHVERIICGIGQKIK